MATLGDTSNYRTILQRYNCKLAENIDAKVILPYMRDVIDSYQIDQVYREENTFKQNEKLLTVVSKAGPSVFLSFMKALDVSYPHLAAQIRQEKRHVTEAKPVSRLHRRIAKQQDHDVRQEQARTDFSHQFALRRDIQVRQLETEILSRHRMKLHKMDANKIASLCNSLNNKYHTETINAQKTQFQKAEKLLDILIKLGPQAFEEFLNALSSVNPELSSPIVEELHRRHIITTV